VARDREQYSGVHTRHGNGVCRTQAILVKRRADVIVVARVDCTDAKIYIEYIIIYIHEIDLI
jgi:hypothetical protein